LEKAHALRDFTDFEKDPEVEKAQSLLTVNTITNYVAAKLNQQQ